MGGGTKGEERRRRHCYRKLKRVEFIRSPFLSPRLSFDFSIVALLQRKYYPRLHTWIQQLDRTENLGRGELKFLEPDFECVYIYIRGEVWTEDRSIRGITGWKRMAFPRGENIFRMFKRRDRIISRVIYSILSTSKAFYICSVLSHGRNGKITRQTRRRCTEV